MVNEQGKIVKTMRNAIKNGNYSVVRFLVKHGIDIAIYYAIGELDKVDACEYAKQLGGYDFRGWRRTVYPGTSSSVCYQYGRVGCHEKQIGKMTRTAKRKWTEMSLLKICGQRFCGKQCAPIWNA